MPSCNTGRNIQKYKGSGGTASTLQEALENGNTASLDIVLQSPAIFVGDGGGLSNINAGSTSGNLQSVTNNGATTTNKITFSNSVTSLETSGNVIVAGNVTASNFYGDGTFLTGVALSTDLASNSTRIGTVSTDLASNSTRIGTVSTDLTSNSTRIGTVSTDLASNSTRIGTVSTDLTSNSTRITNLQNSTIISNSSGITDAFETGDLIYASGQNTLSNLSIGSTNQLLTVSGGIPTWVTPSGGGGGGYWTQPGSTTLIHYNTGNVGIGTSSPAYPLDITGNMNVTGGLRANGSSGTSGQVLTSSGGGAMSWSTVSGSGGSSPWTTSGSGTYIYYNGGNVGISNTAPTNTLDIGSNVSINDSASDVLSVRSGNTFIEKNLYVGGVITSPVGGSMKIDTMTVRSLNVRNMVVVAERPPKNIIIN